MVTDCRTVLRGDLIILAPCACCGMRSRVGHLLGSLIFLAVALAGFRSISRMRSP